MPNDARADAPSDRVALGRAPAKGRYDRATVDAVLDATPHCHLAYVLDDGQPVTVPTLQARIGDHVVVHASVGGRLGMRLAAGERVPVCLTVTLLDGIVVARSGFHHSANHRSVVVLGDAEPVLDEQQRLAALEAITDHVVPGRWSELRAPTGRELRATTVFRLPLTEASAKVRTGPPVDDDADLDGDTWAGVVPVRTVHGPPQPAPDLRDGIEVPASVRRLSDVPAGPALDPDHPGLAGTVTAPGLALALADAWRPGAGLTREGGRDLDVEAVTRLADVGSTGERTTAGLLLALWGQRPVDLSRLDAIDPPTRRLVAAAMASFAGTT